MKSKDNDDDRLALTDVKRDLDAGGPRHEAEELELRKLFLPNERTKATRQVVLKNPQRDTKPDIVPYTGKEAYLPTPPRLPADFVRIGGIPVQKTRLGPILPGIGDIKKEFARLPWKMIDWSRWFDGIGTLNPCMSVPQKTGKVEIQVLPLTRMCQVSADCERVFTVSDSGMGCVVNVLTETVDAGFTVTPDPNYPYQTLPGNPVVHPFTKGGINNKYKRLYVPASFFDEERNADYGGFYVAVVDIDTASVGYLNTVGYIPCDWIPEEVAFTEDNEIGVIANYMQGTVTIFRASDDTVLDASVDLFPGAGGIANGGAWARSVRCANVPNLGNRAFVTLTDQTPGYGGIAIIDLDDPSHPVTNFALSGFVDGVAVTPEKDRILAMTSSNVHIVRVDTTPPVLEKSLNLPSGGGQAYFGGIGARPSGDMCFVATGSPGSNSPTQGTSLAMVNYGTDVVMEFPTSLASQTWGLTIESIGNPLKPHIFVHSLSGMLTIIPC